MNVISKGKESLKYFIIIFFTDTDPLIVDIMCILASKSDSMGIDDRWFEFGLKLGLKVGDLHDIEMKFSGSLECSREVMLLWRSRNISATCEPIVTALDAIGRTNLADHIKNCFSSTQQQPQAQSSINIREPVLYREFSGSFKVTKDF